MRADLLAIAASLGLIAAVPLLAHHSFSAEFDGNRPVTLKGVVTKVDWANPHVYFFIDVKDAKGTVVNWACETDGPNALIRRGWKHESLKAGDQVTVEAYRAKDGSNYADARLVMLPDGRKVFAGSSDDGGR
jgi:hypothetical protein